MAEVAAPWACPACTYHHEGAEAGFLQCAMCGGSKATTETAPAPAPRPSPPKKRPSPSPKKPAKRRRSSVSPQKGPTIADYFRRPPKGPPDAASAAAMAAPAAAASPRSEPVVVDLRGSSDDEAAPPPPPRRHRLSLGAAVELVGLSNAEFNGRRGVVAAPPADLAAGHVAVTVDGRTLSLRRENVVAARSASVPRLLVNDGKAFQGDTWIPVMDGDPTKDNEGVGWVQIGDPGRLGKNHREAHGADCTWGGLSQAPHWKGPWIYCVIDEAVTTKTGKWAGWDTARFVAFDVDAGDNRVALRNPGTKRWLRVTPDGETQASARGDWNDGTKEWERFELHELAGGVGLRSASGRWLTIGGKRTIQLEPRPVRKSKFHDGACSMAWRCRFLTARRNPPRQRRREMT